MACVLCRKGTTVESLTHGKKQTFMSHRKWLPNDHPFRRKKKAFNGDKEFGQPPKVATGHEISHFLNDLSNGNPSQIKFWKRRCIFWRLPYWSRLYDRQNLDVMHIEKIICESIVGTLLGMQKKSKDDLNYRLDMMDMGIRLELALEERVSGTFLPHPCFMLSKEEKKELCRWMSDVKVPDGYASNIRSRVNMDGLKLLSLKSHDCHVLMQQLMPVEIRGSLTRPIREAITRMCLFFNKLCSTVVDPDILDDLQEEIVFVLCSLEMYFPPSFFDVMVHLAIHLVSEVRHCRPVFARWMYPFKRYMKFLKGYVCNRYRPKASMVEAYVVEESIELCSEVLKYIPPIGLPEHKDRAKGGGIFRSSVKCVDSKLLAQAHLYVPRNSVVVRPYVKTHMDIISNRARELRQDLRWVASEHNRTFPSWLSIKVSEEMQVDPGSINGTLKWLLYGPRPIVLRYNGFVINGRRFYTESRDAASTVQNSGVTIAAHSMNVSRAGDDNPDYGLNQFYGKIEQIWELDYAKFRIPIFKCKWANTSAGVLMDDIGFTTVDFNRLGHRNDAFILVEQAMQVFYVRDPYNHALSIAYVRDPSNHARFRKFSTWAEDNGDEPNYCHGSNGEGVREEISANLPLHSYSCFSLNKNC